MKNMRGNFNMSSDEILKKIKEIIFSVPGEIYRYEQPKACFDKEWGEASNKEKAFMLVEDLLKIGTVNNKSLFRKT